MPPATRSTDPYESSDSRPPVLVRYCMSYAWKGLPYGPSARVIALNVRSGELPAFRTSLLVSPSRPLTRKDTVVSCDPPTARSRESLEELVASLSITLVPSFDVQATENGWEVHKPTDGIYRYAYWPALNLHGRATVTFTRATSPGSISTVALEHRVPILRQITHASRVALCILLAILDEI